MPDEAQTPSGQRTGGFAVIIGAVSPGHAKRSQIGRKVADMMRSKGSGKATARSQDPTSNVMLSSHQRRWSADLCRAQTSCVIIVRKNKKEPEPPQRSWSLLRPHTASRSPTKRYSCPPIGVCHSPSPPPSSSSSSSSSLSTTSSCSSPPPVPTSVITGRDPLGWKLHPKSGSTSSHARAKRLSLQIPLPASCPDPKPSPTPGSRSHSSPNADPLPQTKPPLRLKPPRRCLSDSSAFLRPLAIQAAPVVTLEDLRAVHLHPATRPEESDDVFSDGTEGQGKPCKTPPPVPNKSFMARQVAQLIAQSRRRHQTTAPPITAKGDNALSRAGLRLDASRTREPLGSRFPDRGM